MKQTFRLVDRKRRDNACAAIRTAPEGWEVVIREPRRSLDSNAAMWALLTDFAAQVEHYGKRFSKDTWKELLMHAFGKEALLIPSLDGSEIVAIGRSTSALTRSEMRDFLTFIEAEGAARGVVFTAPARETEAA